MRTYPGTFIDRVNERLSDKIAAAEVRTAVLQAKNALLFEDDEAYQAAMLALEATVDTLSTSDRDIIAEIAAELLATGAPAEPEQQ
ncbi:hypothetical protein LZ198_18140 [Myxococcus sp. K15C18031901]|uniref:hypothetical protein n=1 Tax=Myxococcus dinghuensis TaxID=2906761 RepID=UPI0020A748C7|nr:hypothetical protein [Myxococcus dinghuensis]MCP3100794.1 hypothetical protein [Myxococcus dinghuensis]